MAWQERQLRFMVDLLRAQREGAGLVRRQEQRLAALVAQARSPRNRAPGAGSSARS